MSNAYFSNLIDTDDRTTGANKPREGASSYPNLVYISLFPGRPDLYFPEVGKRGTRSYKDCDKESAEEESQDDVNENEDSDESMSENGDEANDHVDHDVEGDGNMGAGQEFTRDHDAHEHQPVFFTLSVFSFLFLSLSCLFCLIKTHYADPESV